jgi:uncharacterized protein YggE
MTEAGAAGVSGPNWQLSEDNPAVTAALTRAIANARVKAEAIAADQGVELGEALIISQSSVSQPYLVYASKAAALTGADSSVTPPPISPENMEVIAGITVTYRMSR